MPSITWLTMRSVVPVVSVALLVGQPHAAGTIPQSGSVPDFAELDAFVMSTMEQRGVPGLQLAIVEGARIVHLRAFGHADPSGRPVTTATPFRIGSNSKSLTALAVIQLVEKGRIGLDARVQRYLPWFRLADSAASGRITIADLLYHISGIPVSAGYESFVQPALTLEQYVRNLRTVKLNRPVGSSFEYSNANYNVLGLIVQVVSGESYATYVKEHIFAPLEMTHTTASEEDENRSGLARGYRWWFGFALPGSDPFSQANLPAGYISSTAEDLAHYLIAQMNDGRYNRRTVLSPHGIAKTHIPGVTTQIRTPDGASAKYAMGWGEASLGNALVLEHDGATFAFHSVQLFDPRARWGMVILMNADDQLTRSEPIKAIERGILLRLKGVGPKSAGPSIKVQYLVINAVLLALSVGLVWPLARLPRWDRWMRRELQTPVRKRRLATTFARVTVELVLPIGVCVVTPLFFGAPWSVVLITLPDVSRWAIAASLALFVTGLAHGTLLARAWSAQRHGRVALRGASPFSELGLNPPVWRS